MPVPPPRRIWICGPTGSGKSTLADELGARLGRPVLHLDDVHWRPNWIEAPFPEELARVADFVRADAWIVDGNYRRLRRPHLDRIDLLVWLDLPLPVTFARVVRRTLGRSLRGEPCCNGNRESLARALLRRDSILLWSLTHHGATRRAVAADAASLPNVVRLRTPGAVREWRRVFHAGPEPATDSTKRPPRTRSNPTSPTNPSGPRR